MIFLIILGSVLTYPFSDIEYIDALFLSSGAATQSGLNTYVLQKDVYRRFLTCNSIDINLLKVEQQVGKSEPKTGLQGGRS